MFDKILIANRGEIACRVMRTARAMGVKTVALYSDADADAPHVKMADEAVHIGPPPAAESYLVIDKILAAIKSTGAQAVHPGYGFLSERAEFADALAAAGVAFIGPPADAIRAMGDKIESKKLAAEAGVSTVPGYLGVIESPARAIEIAEDIGYPVMIKASAGGGGKGMRVARSRQDVEEGFTASMNEARSSFGDDRVFIEKFVERPRHIEIQVLGDTHGNVIYLNERECSIQRRNQKVIEEAPSPFLDTATRKAMGEQSVALSQAVDYCSAGTVEFIVDADRNFYFLEMNTRLQVEHPVTELITGVDLVEQMLRVAAGEKLSITQSDVTIDGWAIESRLYAEDPYRGFLPSIGRLTRYRPPAEGATADGAKVRNDTGVEEGSEISMFYDPMIAKLCSWGPDRGAAIETMRQALDAFEVEGIGHNLPFCAAVMDHPRFVSGEISTAFIAEEYPEGFEGAALSEETLTLIAIAAVCMKRRKENRAAQIEGAKSTFRRKVASEWTASIGDWSTEVAIVDALDQQGSFNEFELRLGDQNVVVPQLDWFPGDTLARIEIEAPAGRAHLTLKIDPTVEGFRVRYRGADLDVRVRSRRHQELAQLMPVKVPADTSKLLLCPMPGLVVRIDAAEGDEVQEGQALAVVEAMKMENILRAEKKAVVKAIKASPGDSLAVDDVIIEFE